MNYTLNHYSIIISTPYDVQGKIIYGIKCNMLCASIATWSTMTYMWSYWVSCNKSRPITATNKVTIDRTCVSYNLSSMHTFVLFVISVQLTITTVNIVCQIKWVNNVSPHPHSPQMNNTKTWRHYYIPI